MSPRNGVALLSAVGLCLSIAAVTSAAPPSAPPKETPAERAIAKAQGALTKDPASAKAAADLALAYARRARETSDPAFYEKGQAVLAPALGKDPSQFGALKAKAWLLLGQHRFTEVREIAVALNKRVPDDVMVYGLMADAATELGDYPAAEEAADWMLKIRPGNVPALTRAAYLREIFGDVDGALELMNMALDQTPFAESEDRAWLLTQIGHLELSRGNIAAAESALGSALGSFPEYHYALGQMARLRTAQGRLDEAVTLERRRYAVSPHPENLYRLAVAIERAGRKDEAKAAFEEFERKARAEMDGPDNSNRELIFYYLDHAKKPEEGLRIAMRESKTRRDVFTREALAWALHRSGRSAEAGTEIEAALSVGIRDAEIAGRAGLIHAALKDKEKARRRFNESLSWNPKSDIAEEARRALSRLG